MAAEVQALISIISQTAAEAVMEYENYGGFAPSSHSPELHPLDSVAANMKLKKIIRKLEGACDQLCATLAPPLHTIVNRAQDYYWSCLRVAVHAKISDVLEKHPTGLHITTLSSIVKIDPEKLNTIMRVLATRHCFYEVQEDVYRNNRLSLMLHSSQSSAAFVDLLTLEGQQAALSLQKYLDDPAYRESKDPVSTVFAYSAKDHGFTGSWYEWSRKNPSRRTVMVKSMPSMNNVMGTLSVMNVFPWQNFQTICDVGSGGGGFAWPLLRQFPNVQVTMFDLPETLEMAKATSRNEDLKVSERAHFVAGDFFEELPVRDYDIYYLRNIIHNWSDGDAVKILQTVRRAMGSSSKVLIHDYVMQPCVKSSNPSERLALEMAPQPMLPNFGYGNYRLYLQDLTMLFMYNARERKVSEVNDICQKCLLQLDNVWDLGETVVLELSPTHTTE
ncbi:S-adenosyl-L-methionine-dependent methyltransferase [Marasmius fiardii PR-910]|nr:S-adenosyl-L-methionine-dependent methyltransferase [Marasmius fiardii PR-910]